jgi:hypothetical protein
VPPPAKERPVKSKERNYIFVINDEVSYEVSGVRFAAGELRLRYMIENKIIGIIARIRSSVI